MDWYCSVCTCRHCHTAQVTMKSCDPHYNPFLCVCFWGLFFFFFSLSLSFFPFFFWRLFTIHSLTAAFTITFTVYNSLTYSSIYLHLRCLQFTHLQQHLPPPSLFTSHSLTAAFIITFTVYNSLTYSSIYHHLRCLQFTHSSIYHHLHCLQFTVKSCETHHNTTFLCFLVFVLLFCCCCLFTIFSQKFGPNNSMWFFVFLLFISYMIMYTKFQDTYAISAFSETAWW